MDYLIRLWNWIYRIGGFIMMPLLIAMFAGIIVYLMPEQPWLRYPVMVLLVLIGTLFGYGTARLMVEDFQENGLIDEIKPWTCIFYYAGGLASAVCVAWVMLFFVKYPDGEEKKACIYVAGISLTKYKQELLEPFTAMEDGKSMTFVPQEDGMYVCNLTNDTLVHFNLEYPSSCATSLAIIPPDSAVKIPNAIDDYDHIMRVSRKATRIVLMSKHSIPSRLYRQMADSLDIQ